MANSKALIERPDIPPPTLSEQLNAQFYDWERRGRGWQLWNRPVALEPSFRPFLFHRPAAWAAVADDSRRPTLLSSVAETVKGWFVGPRLQQAIPADLPDEEFLEFEPEVFVSSSPLVERQILLPSDMEVSKETAQAFLLGLTSCAWPVGYEVIGSPEGITFQWVCREEDSAQLDQLFQAYFPDAVLEREENLLERNWKRRSEVETVIADFGLSREFMLPLQTLRDFNNDPWIGLTAPLTELAEGETAVMQVLFQAAHYPWAESIFRSVTDWQGRSFFADAPEIVALAKEKISSPLYAALIRIAARSPDPSRAWRIVKALGSGLVQLASPSANELIPLNNEDYPDSFHEEDLLLRQTHRSGMLLNTEELISLVHLPSEVVRTEKLRRLRQKTKAAPVLALGGKIVLGENAHQGKIQSITLKPEQRVRHTYVIGASGTGKSTLLLSLIVQDIQQGNGLAVLDPHGDLIDQILGHISEERYDDVILFDPSDAEYPIGFNILSAHSELEKNLISSDLVAVFRRLSTSWGDQMTSVLGNAILAFLESERGGTLADLCRFLVESSFRKQFLETVQDREIVYYWQKEFPLLSGKPQAPLLTRLDTFLRPKLIRHMVCQKENRLDFAAIMNEGKIFLAKLSQGAIGEENAYLLGTLLVSKIHQMTLSRQEIAESQRRDFFLYIDEFHNFVTPSMSQILTGVRKYRLGLILAHQELRQIGSRDMEVASAAISNPYTRICFRLGDDDARKLASGFSFYEQQDLQSLGIGEAIARMERAEYDFNLRTSPLAPVESGVAERRREKIVALSRAKYGTPRAQVEKLLATTSSEEETRPLTPGALLRIAQPSESEAETPSQQVKEASAASPLPVVPADKRAQEPVSPRRPKARPAEPPLLGRGGQQHKYLQQLIKQWAEGMGYHATIEKQILDGRGSVDVALEKGEATIACEISITSTPEQEVGNIEKCLQAGFTHVVVVASEEKRLSQIRTHAESAIGKDALERVRFLTSEGLFGFIEEVEAQLATRHETVKGYKVKVRYQPLAEEEKKARKQAISKVILQAMRRFGK